MEPVIAMIYDCDGTLARDTTDFILEQYQVPVADFWTDVGKQVKRGWDPPLAYLSRIIELVKDGSMAGLTRKKLRQIGRDVDLFLGLPEMFGQLNQLITRRPKLRDAGIRLEHYIVSGGIAETIRGLKLARYMTAIYGCELDFDEKGSPIGVRSSITFTEKTKFVYAINKGISEKRLRRSPYFVNDAICSKRRRIPLHNMIYIGDGPSDIPCFSMITAASGDGIGVAEKPTRGYELAKGKRTTTGPYSPDYRRGSDMRGALESAILDKAYGIQLELQRGFRRGSRH